MSNNGRNQTVEIIKETAKENTVSPPVRTYRTILFRAALLLVIVIFGLLTFAAKTIPYFPIDLQISHAIQTIDSPLFAGFMNIISWPGFLPQSVLIIGLIAFTLYVYGQRWEAVTCLMTAMLSGVTNQLLKQLIQRPRPVTDLVDVFETLTSYSFPSGHVMFYTTVFGFSWYLVYTSLKHSLQRSFLLGLFGSLILLVGVSRIYLGQHWASDVLGAYLLGGLILKGMIIFHDWGKQRFFLRPSVEPDFTKK